MTDMIPFPGYFDPVSTYVHLLIYILPSQGSKKNGKVVETGKKQYSIILLLPMEYYIDYTIVKSESEIGLSTLPLNDFNISLVLIFLVLFVPA